MIKLFVAIEIKGEVEKNLAQLPIESDYISWIRPDYLHITLSFIGEVNVWMYRQIKKQLEQVQFEAFEVRVKGAGAFPSKSQPSVLWAGLEHNNGLHDLQAQVKELLFNMGLKTDDRTFHPHITLGRVSERGLPVARQFLKENRSLDAGMLSVKQFSLFSSRMTQNGAVHTRVADYKSYQDETIP